MRSDGPRREAGFRSQTATVGGGAQPSRSRTLLLVRPRSQEEMYSYVTVSDDQNTKGKGTTVVQDS
jgi:hypothetical protein